MVNGKNSSRQLINLSFKTGKSVLGLLREKKIFLILFVQTDGLSPLVSEGQETSPRKEVKK